MGKPVKFVCKWTDKGTGGNRDGSLWRAVPPTGFVALSDVAVWMSNSGNQPGTERTADEIDADFRCVRADLTDSAWVGDMIWSDAGSGGKYDGACWAVMGSSAGGMLVGSGSNDTPINDRAKQLNASSAKRRRMA